MAFSEGSPSAPCSPGRCRVPGRRPVSAGQSQFPLFGGYLAGWVVQTKVENLLGTFPCTVYPRGICLN